MRCRTPNDELLLAKALQAAHARRLKPVMGDLFCNRKGNLVRFDDPRMWGCCALGALALAKVCYVTGAIMEDTWVDGLPAEFDAEAIAAGNDDFNDRWSEHPDDRGETMGHAFQLAMGGYR